MFVKRFMSMPMCLVAAMTLFVACSSPDPAESQTSQSAPAPATEAPANETQAAPEPAQVAQAQTEPPEVVAERFIEAGNTGDRDTFLSLLTEKARAGFGEEELGDDSGFDSYTIGETTIDGETATVAVDATDDGEAIDVTLRMRQELAQWRIFGMDIDLGDGLVMKMDLEKIGGMLDSMADSMLESMGESMATSMSEGFETAFTTSPETIQAQRLNYAAVRAISNDDYEASWKNSVDYRGQTALAALTALAESMGCGIDVGDHADALAEEVAADVTGLSKAEAVERIAAGAGLHPVFPDPQYGDAGMFESMATALAEGLTQMLEESGVTIEGLDLSELDGETPTGALTFAAGDRPLPAVFVGPFVVEIAELTENAPNTTGSLSIVVRAFGLDPALFTLIENDSDGTRFDAVVDAKNRPLIDEDMMYLSGGTSDGARYADSFSLSLRNLIREVDAIARIAGVQRLQRPTAITEIALTDASEGATAEADGFTATVDSAGDYTQITIQTPEGFDADAATVVAIAEDAEGEPVHVGYVSTMAWQEGEIDVSLNLDAAPAALQLKLVTAMDVHEYPFEFTNVPLKRAAEQPEKIEELNFEGDAPVSVEFLEITDPDDSFGKIRVRVTNHSNKDAEDISLNLVYLDANGEELDDFPAGLSAEYAFENGEMQSKPAIAKQATRETETTAFSMPEGTEQVRVEVRTVDFVDATQWSAEN